MTLAVRMLFSIFIALDQSAVSPCGAMLLELSPDRGVGVIRGAAQQDG